LKGQPELSNKQKKVVDSHKKDIRKEINAVFVISNFACTIFGKVECTENGNMACT
jgi:hypothetical protein